jgi:hypothetical protein
MQSFSGRSRLVRASVVITMVCGLVATTFVDVAVAGSRRAHDRKVAAARALGRAEHRYFQQLTPIALALYADAQGLKQALSGISLEPSPGALVGARDAFAYARRVGTISSAIRQMRALTPPRPLSVDQRRLLADVDHLGRAVTKLGGFVGEHDLDRLTTDLNGSAASDFVGAEFDVGRSVAEIYRHGHAKAPYDETLGDVAGPAAETWIDDADSACLDATLQLVPDYVSNDHSPSAARKAMRDYQRALTLLDHRITTIAAPSGRGKPPLDLTRRFPALAATAQAFGNELRAIQRQDAAGVTAALVELKTVSAQLRQLAAAMRTYGAAGCANILDGWAGTPKSHPTRPVV